MIYFKLEILIPCVAITSMIRQNMCDTTFLWFNWSDILTEKCPNFSIHTTTVKELVY